MLRKFFPYYFICFLFIDNLFPFICFYLDIPREGSLFRAYIGSFGVMSTLFYLGCYRGNKIKCYPLFIGLLLFGCLYLLTSTFYDYSNKYYFGQFLRWGASCVPATLMGLCIVYDQNRAKIDKSLPFILFIFTPFVALSSLKGSQMYGQFSDDEAGLNYQLIAYMMALFFAISLYCLVFAPHLIKNRIIRLGLWACLGVDAFICLTAGGRGGVILFGVYIFIFAWLLRAKGIVSTVKLIKIIIIAALLFLVVAEISNIWEYAGFQRAIHPLNQQVGRKDDWQEVLSYYYKSPIFGNGLGSDFYTWGFYSHNIFVDFLAETGLIGFVILSSIFIWIFRQFYLAIRRDNFYVLLFLFFINGFVMNCFSGYWISAWQNWFALGIAYGLSQTRHKSSIKNHNKHQLLE